MPKLYYIIGASGVGKDAIITYARQNMPANRPCIVCHRYITRSANAGSENHIALTAHEFEMRKQHDCFAMHWHSHGYQYAIGMEIYHWMKSGLNVVINGSRAYLNAASSIFPDMIPVLIQASDDVVLHRLTARGREPAEDIQRRIARSQSLEPLAHPNLRVIENNHTLSLAGDALIELMS